MNYPVSDVGEHAIDEGGRRLTYSITAVALVAPLPTLKMGLHKVRVHRYGPPDVVADNLDPS